MRHACLCFQYRAVSFTHPWLHITCAPQILSGIISTIFFMKIPQIDNSIRIRLSIVSLNNYFTKLLLFNRCSLVFSPQNQKSRELPVQLPVCCTSISCSLRRLEEPISRESPVLEQLGKSPRQSILFEAHPGKGKLFCCKFSQNSISYQYLLFLV